jgi:ribonuclease D
MAWAPVAHPILVSDAAALAHAVARLRDAPLLALDTEGNGMHAYRARLCVVQLCVAADDAPAEEVFVVDTLALSDLSPLAELLGAHGPRLIIHDVSYDARLLAWSGLPLAGAIDTSLHARFLGLRETGLGALLTGRYGLQLDKTYQQADWARRPLSTAHLDYLTADVTHLGPLAAALRHEAEAAGIAPEIAVETEYALANARADEASLPAYARLKGARELLPSARAVLRELAAVREEAAARFDLPVGRVVSNQGLLTIAKARPRTIPELRRAAGLTDRGMAIAGELLAAIGRGERAGDVPEEERVLFARERLPGGEIARRKARESALAVWRQTEAAARGVDLQVVLPGHALSDLARLGPKTLDALAAIPGFGAVRVARYGTALLALIAQADATP